MLRTVFLFIGIIFLVAIIIILVAIVLPFLQEYKEDPKEFRRLMKRMGISLLKALLFLLVYYLFLEYGLPWIERNIDFQNFF